MNNIQDLMWKRFYEITKIPRPSKKEDKIRTYLLDTAKSLNLIGETDNAGNVLIHKPATQGREKESGIILQAHMDMVCEKIASSNHNFNTDPIDVKQEGDFLTANGTTLGADDGIGIAMALAILECDKSSLPALECLFTVDEESGLFGASNIKEKWLKGKTLINLDSEEEGEFCVGCAGGTDTLSTLKFNPEQTPEGYFFLKVNISGLKGGHSGSDIAEKRANAIKLLTQYLAILCNKTDLRIASVKGGNLRNAIPREASAVFAVPFIEKESARIELNIFASKIENQWKDAEPNLKIELESTEGYPTLLPKNISDELLNALTACPHGVTKMSDKIKGLVETSTNLAAVSMPTADSVFIETSQRSSFENEKKSISKMVAQALTTSTSTISFGKDYPGWEPNFDSAILKKAINAYKDIYRKEPIVKVIHAGLECGVFLRKYSDWDMVSFGPDLKNVHTPDEKASISSANRTICLLFELLKKA